MKLTKTAIRHDLTNFQEFDCSSERALLTIGPHLTQFEVEVALHDALEEFSKYIRTSKSKPFFGAP